MKKEDLFMFGFLEHKDYVELAVYKGNDIEQIIIPTEYNGKPVTRVGDGCFFDHPEIVNISFSDKITSIGHGAFALCKGIEELILPDSIIEIEDRAFRDCIGLKRIVMPKHLKVLRAGLFAFCYFQSDVEIILPEELEEIEVNTFYCSGLFKLVIPENVKKIGRGAFYWGPEAITSLPYDEGWYFDWPYGEEIEFADGQTGKVTDYKELINHCMALEITMKNKKCNIFYPCINDRDFVFKKPESQKMMQDERKNIADIEEIYQAWNNGLL